MCVSGAHMSGFSLCIDEFTVAAVKLPDTILPVKLVDLVQLHRPMCAC